MKCNSFLAFGFILLWNVWKGLKVFQVYKQHVTISTLTFNLTGNSFVYCKLDQTMKTFLFCVQLLISILSKCLLYRSLLSHFVSFHEVCCVTETCGYFASDFCERRVVASLMNRIILSKLGKMSVTFRVNLVKLKEFLYMRVL